MIDMLKEIILDFQEIDLPTGGGHAIRIDLRECRAVGIVRRLPEAFFTLSCGNIRAKAASVFGSTSVIKLLSQPGDRRITDRRWAKRTGSS